MPAATKPIVVSVNIQPHLNAFLRGEMEEYDFYLLCAALATDDQSLFSVIIDVVAPRAPHLANFVAARRELPAVTIPTDVVEFIPACVTPYNTALHDLPLGGDLVIKSSAIVQDFKYNLERSRYFAVDFHGAADNSGTDEIGFVTFCLRAKIFHALPRVYQNTIAPIIQILQSTPRPVFVYRWSHVQNEVLKQFGWTPEEVIEVQDVAREIGIPPTIDAIAEKTVGGKFCRRGSNFTDVSLPSEVARRHSGIRTTLFYEFVVRFRHLRENRQQPQRSDGDRPRETERLGRDQETFSPGERRRRHDDRSRGRDRDRDRSHRR